MVAPSFFPGVVPATPPRYCDSRFGSPVGGGAA
jgi:hypothetical protein